MAASIISLSVLALLTIHCSFVNSSPISSVHQVNEKLFSANAAETVSRLHRLQQNKNVAKNVILFLGDGMSISTVAMARVYAGGVEKQLAFERFPYIGMSKTYNVDYQVPDSAGTVTAYLTGVKGNYGTIGVNAQVKAFDCQAELDNRTHTHSIAKWAMDAGKDAGFVTTTRVTHASPAGVYAHTANRDRENDNEVSKDGCDKDLVQDIAHQLVHGDTGKRLKVIMGGGRREFLHKDLDPETEKTGKRKDKRNLIDEWLNLAGEGENRTYVWNRDDLMAVDPKATDRLMGLFEPSHCVYNLNRIRDNLHQEPTLAEMVDKATDVLRKNENGFFLFVEGGLIDRGHHDTWARMALDETVEFSKAIQLAREKFPEEDTLIVVTSDHSHAVSFAGFPGRTDDIFGSAGTADDQLPYMTISYGNGLGFYDHVDAGVSRGRVDIRRLDTTQNEFRFPATLPLESETHGGEDVAVYASGPWSHLFTGSYEQNTIPHMMAYALCVGDGLTACK
ncbi:membrane-bound alkaline phosphatase-like [Sabethes cyaneus]|uniref:membrane-bound alkaline phosphatase-like n=1 Tax=Sabethes cyaneus TaxID=53552 RepID=UPI00237E64EF|nr:membrane-bound alkaline phosphatase-like [Sabethes cyaneus]